jgi:hypothetical protein
MNRTRNYQAKDVEMLMASRTIVKNFLSNLPELKTLRTNWSEEYANALSEKIDAAIDDYLGVERKKELKEATEDLVASQTEVIRDLNFLKTQVKVDLPDQADKILEKLGYVKYGDRVRALDQEALIEMLFRFRKEMTESVKAKICAGGINPALIDRITGYADQLKSLNTIQESLKKTTKEVTAEVIGTFNDIYEEVVGICKITQSFYSMEPLKKEQFVFSGIINNMNLN